MNKNFLKNSYPTIAQDHTHIIIEDAQYLDADKNFAPKGKMQTVNPNILPKGSKVVLLEYGLGYKSLWSKVIYDDKGEKKFYYVESIYLDPIQQIKDKYLGTSRYASYTFPFNDDKSYQPDELAPKIDWKEQQRNVVYEDKRNAKFCIHYEVDITEITSDSNLRETIKNACYEGTSLILKSRGFKYDLEFVKSLIENYFIFSRAEEFYFPLRPCSTFRVLVTIPSRILYAKDENDIYVLMPEKVSAVLVDPIVEAEVQVDTAVADSDSTSETPPPPEEDKNLIKLTYKNKGELDLHFSFIMLNLSWYFTVFCFPPGRIWSIDPKETPDIIPGFGALNLPFEQNRLGALFKQINEFLYKNIHEQVNLLQDDGKENFINIYKIDPSLAKPQNFSSISDILSINKTTALDFNGELEIYIDKNNLELKEIKISYSRVKKDLVPSLIVNSPNQLLNNAELINAVEKVPIQLNIDAEAFYKHESVLNKTSLNYLLKVKPPTSFIELLVPQIKELMQRQDLTAFGKFVGGLLTSIDSVLQVPEYLLGEKEQSLEKFLKDNHYPAIYSVYAEPVDFGACADKLGSTREQRIAHLTASFDPAKKLEQINKFRADIENYKKGGGSNLFIQSLTDVKSIQDENIKILFGLKEAPGPSESARLNQFLTAANMFDWPRFLREAIKCSGAKFDLERLTNILNDFEKFQQLVQNPDLLLLCNPLATKVQNILDQIVNFSLPELPVYDPQASLANELKDLIVKLINDLVVFAIRAMITGAIKDCSRDNNPNFSNQPDSPNSQFDNVANNIDRANNNRDIDSFFNDYFGLNDQLQDSPSSEGAAEVLKTNFKQTLKSFLEDVITCLTTKELCLLLTGGILEEDAYDVIFSILRRKYNTPENKFNLAAKLNSKEEIGLFFKKIKNTYNLSICDDIANDTSPIIPANPLCDDGRKEKRERALLQNKGLSDELIDDLLNDFKQKDEEDLRNVLDFLNKENPFDLNNIPTVLCKKGPNGEVIPPLLSLAPPVKSFKKMVDGIYSEIYNSFDENAKIWYKNTYSISSSAPKNTLKFDDNTGDIVFDNSIGSGENKDPELIKEITLPSYIFKDVIEKNSIITDNNTTTINLNGYKEQSLDILFVTDQTRTNLISVYRELKNFSESLLHLLDTYKLLVATNSINNFTNKQNLSDFLQKDFSVFLKLIGSFYANTVAVVNDSDKNGMVKRVLNFQDSDYANAFFSEEKPISLVPAIMNWLLDSGFNNNLSNAIDALKENLVEETAIAATEQLNISYSDPKNFLSSQGVLFASYEKFKSLFGSYKKFSTVENVINLYPTFELELINSGAIAKNSEVTNQLELYDRNQFIVNKNGYDYINRKIDCLIDNSVLQYITGTLNIPADQIQNKSKKDIFNIFLSTAKTKYGNSYYTSSLDIGIKKKDDKIFDDFGFLDNPNSFLQPNFNGFVALYNKQLDTNILSSPFLQTVTVNVSKPVGPPSDDFSNDTRPSKSIKPPSLKDGPPASKVPLTQYMSLLSFQTPTQKACNIKPHYLDIDSIKSDAAKAKEESYCLEEIKNEKIKKGEEIKTSELSKIELTDTQFILLDGAYRTYVRAHLHEIMLRAISVYGFYDPQTIRKNDLFLSLMTDLLEAELRSKDNTLFLMMMGYFAKVFQFKNPELSEIPSYKELFKQVVSFELKNHVLPKMSKRINEDTNQKLSLINPPKKISLTSVDNYYKEDIKALFIDPKSKAVYIRVTGTQLARPKNPNNNNSEIVLDSLTTFINKQSNATLDIEIENLKYFKQEIYFQKIYQSNTSLNPTIVGDDRVRSEIIREFGRSTEYKLLFKYLFPLSDQLVFRHFTSVFGCGTKKTSSDSFRTAKNYIAMISKKMATNGVDIAPDQNNFQDMANNDSANIFVKFIIDALITAPFKIVKAFTELTEPNIALSSKAYMLTKSFIPETPSFMVPALSFPLGIPNPAFPLGIIPWVNIPLALFYLIGGLWFEEESSTDSQAKNLADDFMKKMLSGGEAEAIIDCSNVTNPDRIQTSIIYDGEPGYNFLNPSQDMLQNPEEEPKTQINQALQEFMKQQEIKIPLISLKNKPKN